MSHTATAPARSTAATFTIYRYETIENRAVWTGTVDSADAPLAFIPAMREYGARMVAGDTLALNAWHYAVKVA